MDLWHRDTLRSFFVPGGGLFAAAIVLFQISSVPVSASTVASFYYAFLLAGILLALRFRSSRVLSSLLILLIASRALEFFSGRHSTLSGAGHIALELMAVLLPLNFLLLSFLQERGLTPPGLGPIAALLFLESVFVAVSCRPGAISAPGFLSYSFFRGDFFRWTHLPQLAWAAFSIICAVLVVRLLANRKPIDAGLFWALAAVFFGLQAGGIGKVATAYFATAELILVCAVVENSYFLAYHDELTTLPARRAFNEALLTLPDQYTVAVVDIDHFKSFNDRYGHDVGDQVLRMVAAKLANGSGGGRAFRTGGEEFAILFPGERLREALPHLEILRMEIESTAFQVRAPLDRRTVSHGTDRRRLVRGKKERILRRPPKSQSGRLSVTVSIGVAEPTARKRQAAQVVRAADKALYRAKESGRNRVETNSPEGTRLKRISA